MTKQVLLVTVALGLEVDVPDDPDGTVKVANAALDALEKHVTTHPGALWPGCMVTGMLPPAEFALLVKLGEALARQTEVPGPSTLY